MVYGYICAGKNMQSAEKQRSEIQKFARRNSIAIGEWVEESVVKKAKKNDVIIVSEISKIGRSLLQAMGTLNILLDIGAKIWTAKGGYRLGDNISGKTLAFAFGLSAEIERKIISERSKETLARLKGEGRAVGRPAGRKNAKLKLTDRADMVKRLLMSGCTKIEAARQLCVHRETLAEFLKKIKHIKKIKKSARRKNS